MTGRCAAPASSLRRGHRGQAQRFRRRHPATLACGRGAEGEGGAPRVRAGRRGCGERGLRDGAGAGAGAGRVSLKRTPGWRSASGIDRGPTRRAARVAAPASPPRRVCEVALTWQWLRGAGQRGRPSLCRRRPRQGRSGVCKSGRRPRLPVASAPRRPTCRRAHPGTQAGARGFREEPRGRKQPGRTRRAWVPTRPQRAPQPATRAAPRPHKALTLEPVAVGGESS